MNYSHERAKSGAFSKRRGFICRVNSETASILNTVTILARNLHCSIQIVNISGENGSV